MATKPPTTKKQARQIRPGDCVLVEGWRIHRDLKGWQPVTLCAIASSKGSDRRSEGKVSAMIDGTQRSKSPATLWWYSSEQVRVIGA